ncbi:DUF4280 domain-containing protein [Xylophilus rhododendri]|uniref:DUF4280 domain-containing protein n=1 Tax=Xylophilus rhododendri TaxID=2697032 RepID=A0A857JCQ0_9BURK|nr:DUF4280 domain-containing protein [Xylophilus rhododendri]QHJ00972.1 DUF4280 domain-containing protein [Xylophilus rhododendri]
MPIQVVTTAQLMCTFGLAPSVFNATPRMVNSTNLVAGTVMDNVFPTNIPPFGMCNSLANPAVASATSAALGVLTPMPCAAVFPGPWVPGAVTVTIKSIPALDNNCKLTCAYGGMVSIAVPGQVTHMIP